MHRVGPVSRSPTWSRAARCRPGARTRDAGPGNGIVGNIVRSPRQPGVRYGGRVDASVPGRSGDRHFSCRADPGPGCTMAYWSVALSGWGNPFAVFESPEQLTQGAEAVRHARAVGARTVREQGYVDAVAQLYTENVGLRQPARMQAYKTAMASVAPVNTKKRSEAPSSTPWHWPRLLIRSTIPMPTN